MRSGTTALHHYLRDHPNVAMASPKEVHFFDRHFDRGLDWYRRQFRGTEGADVVGEATQSYMYDTAVLDRMAESLPDARLVAVLRHPVDRAYSHYWFNRSRGREPLSFPEAVRQEPERRAHARTPAERRRISYVDRGRYLAQLQQVAARYPRDQLLVVLFEAMRDRPEVAYRTVCRFLGVDDGFLPPRLGTPVNEHVAFRSPRLQRLTRRVPSPMAQRTLGRLNSRALPVPPMDPELRAELVAAFAHDNRALAEWLEADLSSWAR